VSSPSGTRLDGSSGATARVEGVLGLDTLDATSLRPIDLSRVPGARLVSQAGWHDATTRVFATCAAAPTDRYVSGLEPWIFDQATRLARAAARIDAPSTGRSASRVEGTTTTRRTELEGARVDGRAVELVVVEHALGFAGPEREAVLCSAVCAGASARCAEVRIALEGSLVAPPEPGPLARALLWAANQPSAAGALAAFAAGAAAALVVARRPRPPRLDGVPRLTADPSRALPSNEQRP
jgi:hypothetical protein